jgi:hypothetical protein
MRSDDVASDAGIPIDSRIDAEYGTSLSGFVSAFVGI